MALLSSFTRYKASKSEWHWIWPFKVTQDQMWWCHWIQHTWFPIHKYSNHMPNSHRLALIATQNVISYPLLLGPTYASSKVHRMAPKWHWTLKGQMYPIYVVPRVPNVTPFCSTISRFPNNWGFWLLHRLLCWIWKFGEKTLKIGYWKFHKSPT